MLCQKCQQRPASVFFTQTINNETTQMHLCEVCAKEANPIYGGMNIANFNPLAALTNILNSVISVEGATLHNMTPLRDAQPVDPQLQCSHCGYQLSAFRQTGRLGCTCCYESFRQVLMPVVKGIHGAVKHVEEVPQTTDSNVEPKSVPNEKFEIGQIREKIKDAIENERYEEAARLRDEIKKIEDK